MSLTLRLVGQAGKRGLLKRLPSPDELAAEAASWVRAEHVELLRSSRTRTVEDRTELVLELHPAAEPMVISISRSGEVAASADTAAAGPGYHTFVARLLERLGAAIGIGWAPGAGGPVDRVAVERAHLAWLGHVLSRARESRRVGQGGIHLGTPAGVRFTIRGAIATPLGPRDEAWLDTALADARLATSIRPWWADATGARYLLDRALSLMWLHVRWRPPASDSERSDLDEALWLLRRAYPLDPALPYPWREWLELLSLRGAATDPMARLVAERAAATPAGEPIGYRRGPVTVVHEGWSLEVPGSFAERRSDEEWAGAEAGRTVTIAGVETGANGTAMRADAFLARVAADLGPAALEHRAGELAGRARLTTDTSSGIEVGILDGYAAVTGRGAAIRVTFSDPDDWEWAVGCWRALRPA